MSVIHDAIAWLEQEEVFYLENDDVDEARYAGRAIMALQSINKWADAQMFTLDELREMSGEPVFLQFGDGEQLWGIVCVDGPGESYPYFICQESDYCEPDLDFYNMEHNDPQGHYGLHILGWRALTNRPRIKRVALDKGAK